MTCWGMWRRLSSDCDEWLDITGKEVCEGRFLAWFMVSIYKRMSLATLSNASSWLFHDVIALCSRGSICRELSQSIGRNRTEMTIASPALLRSRACASCSWFKARKSELIRRSIRSAVLRRSITVFSRSPPGTISPSCQLVTWPDPLMIDKCLSNASNNSLSSRA